MAMTYATISGKITQPGTDIGIRVELAAVPMTTAGALKFPAEDRITLGPQTARTNSAGVLATLKVPTNHGLTELYWKITATPIDKIPGLKSWVLGTFEITGDARLEDLVEIDTLAVSSDLLENMSDLVAAAEAAAADVAAVVATTDGLMTAVDASGSTAFRVQQDARLSASYVGRAEAATYTYNTDGTVATETVGGFTTTYAYNSDGTVHTATRNGVTLTYTYDASGNVTAVA